MFKKGLFVVLLLTLGAGVVWARNVSVTGVSISDVNVGAGTCTINYTLSRTNPTISASQPVWVFVKYRLTTDTDYTGWQDTNDHDPSNDASDDNDDSRANSVNANLTAGDRGMVESAGSKTITWHWGGTGGIGNGTGLSSTNSVRLRVYVVEMVKVGGGNYAMKDDANAESPLSGTTAHSGSDYHLQKYPVTNKMYADFLNACANRHDGSADADHVFYNSNMTDGDDHDRLDMTGTIGTDAVFTANTNQEDYTMTHVDWWNAYDWCKWAGLSMPTEEMFEYEASDRGTRDFPWGDDVPTADGGGNVRCNMDGVSPSHASDVRSYDGYGEGLSGLSAHSAAELGGNVWEWQFTATYAGFYNSDYSTDSDSYAGYGGSSDRVVRGGNWAHVAALVRAGSRNHYWTPGIRGYGLGFRAAR